MAPEQSVNPRDQSVHQRAASARRALASCRFLDALLTAAPRKQLDGLGDEIVAFLYDGSWMTKLSTKQKSYKRYFKFYKASKRLCYEGSRKWDKTKSRLHVRDIIDIRSGFHTDTFNKASEKLKLKETCCLSIIFNSHIRKPLDLIADTPEIRDAWLMGLHYMKYCYDQLMQQQDEQTLIRDLFYSSDVTNDNLLQFDEVWHLLQRMSVKMSRDDAFSKFISTDHDEAKDHKGNPALSLREFVHLYHELCKRPEVRELYEQLKDKKEGISPLRLQRFMNEEQKKLDFSTEDALHVIEDCETAIYRRHGNEEHLLSLDGFYFLLSSPHMEVFNQGHGKIYQDMTQPLSHYFICSSHNTYLVGDQLSGRSSIEGYIRALMDGCRCVELDCWDGPDNNPVVTHGHTLTSKILFKDIIEDAIFHYAFCCSDYPLILSMENHCSLAQQEVMATILKKSLGDMLYTVPVDADLSRLPSPEDLKGKILIKCKKNKTPSAESFDEPDGRTASFDNDEADDSVDTDEQDSADGERKQKKGKKSSMAQGLSDLVNYVQSVTFAGFDQVLAKGRFYEMSSYSEKKALKFAEVSPTEFVRLSELQLCRTYPKGTRTDSSNYCPITLWNVGAQLVALNFQRHDVWMQVHRGKFRDNGGCGYVLKPNFMRTPTSTFNPTSAPGNFATQTEVQYFRIRVISGCHLPKPRGSENDKDIVDPYVTLYVYGAQCDWIKMKTASVKNNGLNPQWNEVFEFHVNIPQLALIHFVVKDANVTADELIGQFCLPLTSIEQGYRHVKLESCDGQPLGPAAVFVHISVQDRPFSPVANGDGLSSVKHIKKKSVRSYKSSAQEGLNVTKSERSAEHASIPQKVAVYQETSI